MKTIKKLITTLALIITSLIVPGQVNAEEVINIGILQAVEHGSLNENYKGFVDELEKLGYKDGENIKINYQNGGGDKATIASMAEMLAGESDYIYAIATPPAQALANVTQEVPIYISSVADPVGAGLCPDLEASGRNITGTTNIGPIEDQLKLMFSVYPEAKKVGILYDSGEVNAQYQVDIAVDLIKEMGAEPVVGTISSTNDIQSVFGPILDEVDVVYLVTDNTIATAMALVGDMAKEKKLGIFGASNDMILENGLATYGLDYYELGAQTARMMVDQIENGTDPATNPIQKAEKLELIVNEDYAKEIGIDPASIKMD